MATAPQSSGPQIFRTGRLFRMLTGGLSEIHLILKDIIEYLHEQVPVFTLSQATPNIPTDALRRHYGLRTQANSHPWFEEQVPAL